MKNSYLVLVIFVIVSLFSSCKKGEEDPSISLRTRTNRLTGKWKLESAIGSINLTYSNDLYIEYQYYHNTKVNNTFRYKKTVYYTTGYYINFDTYSFILNINKAGTTSSYTLANCDNMSYNNKTNGTWKWSKDKKQLYFTELNIVYEDLVKQISERYHEYLGFDISENIIEHLRTFTVTRLTNKELILRIVYKTNFKNQDIRNIDTFIEFVFNKEFD